MFFMQIAWMRQREVGLEAQREAQFEARQILVTGFEASRQCDRTSYTKKSILLSLPYQAPVDFNVWSAIGWKYCLNSGVLWTLTCLRDITRQCLVACTSIANSVGMSMSLVHNAGSCCFLVKPEVAYRLRHAENPWTLPLQGPGFRKGIYI